ncbi:MAG: signal peptidase II [Candidatus Omnitrophica bacterium]|nr:signal peptidase II [Candidatus Omnitrophota bacterium]MCM8799364.1 signal peptidase II [Candidatus Omnitrophota bacterium]
MPAGKRKDLRNLFLSFLFLAIFSLDRFTKYYALKIPSQGIPIIKGIFHLTLVFNTGSAFGLFKDTNYLFIIFSLLTIIFILRYLKKLILFKIKFAFILVLSGAVGNIVDRIIFGYVIDFLDFRIWPVFNFADISITLGIFLILISILKNKR